MLKQRGTQARLLVHILALLPLAWLLWDWSQGNLTANPIQDVQLRTGRYALILLVLTLAYTPVSLLLGARYWPWLRRTLGLYVFFYAGLHFVNFIAVDYRFDFGLLYDDIAGKRYVFAGLAALIILIILAVTSLKSVARWLGGNWQKWHWLVYVAGVVAVVHYFWQVKADAIRLPLIYGAIVVTLLLLRTPWVKKGIGRLRSG